MFTYIFGARLQTSMRGKGREKRREPSFAKLIQGARHVIIPDKIFLSVFAGRVGLSLQDSYV